jgi:hypothetical protein
MVTGIIGLFKSISFEIGPEEIKQGGYTDEQLADAAYELAGEKLPGTEKTGLDRAFFYSNLFDGQLIKHCPKLKVNGR